MSTPTSLVRCPMCGSVHLDAVYDESSENAAVKSTLKAVILTGIVGLVWSLFKPQKKQTKYWVCLQCGNVFEM